LDDIISVEVALIEVNEREKTNVNKERTKTNDRGEQREDERLGIVPVTTSFAARSPNVSSLIFAVVRSQIIGSDREFARLLSKKMLVGWC
jgi:hypothetical protein